MNRFMRDAGLTYSQACRVYDTMCSTFGDAITSGNRVTIGRIGALMPVWKQPREINMHFKVSKGKKVETGIKRTYFMGGRYDFKFKVYRRFMETNELRWFTDTQDPKNL